MSAADQIIDNLGDECHRPRPFLRRNLIYSRSLPSECVDADNCCQVKIKTVDVYLAREGASENGSLVERQYSGTILGAIVTGDDNRFQVHSVARSLVKVCVTATQEDHEAFAAKYVLTASLPADSEEECSWPSTCADVITEDDDCRPKLREPRLMLHLVDTVQHRIERLKKGHRYSSGSLRSASSFIEHFPTATDAHIGLLKLPGGLSSTPLQATLRASAYRVRATVSGSNEHPGSGPRERSRTLRLNKAAAVPPTVPQVPPASEAGSDAAYAGSSGAGSAGVAAVERLTHSTAGLAVTEPAHFESDGQHAMSIAEKLTAARSTVTFASLQGQTPDSATTVKVNSVTLRYHDVGYRPLPTLQLRGSPLDARAGCQESCQEEGKEVSPLQILKDFGSMKFHVEYSTSTMKGQQPPAGPSCNTLEIYHKDHKDRQNSILVEKVEALLCPACGVACSSAAALHAHITNCHDTLEFKFVKKNGPAAQTKARWKLLLSRRDQEAEQPEPRSRYWHQNFMYWRGKLFRPDEAKSAEIHASFRTIRLLRSFMVQTISDKPAKQGMFASTHPAMPLVVSHSDCPDQLLKELLEHAKRAWPTAEAAGKEVAWILRPRVTPFDPSAPLDFLPQGCAQEPTADPPEPEAEREPEEELFPYPPNSQWPCTYVSASQPHDAVVGYGDRPFHASGATPAHDAAGTYLPPGSMQPWMHGTPSHPWPGASPLHHGAPMLPGASPASPHHGGGMMPPPPPQQPPGSPSYAPSSPVHTPASPMHAPASPVYATRPPMYAPASPIYSPASPVYAPRQPVHHPASPMHAPASPIHHPASPMHAPALPMHRPDSPIQRQWSPVYARSSPAYSPESPVHCPASPPHDYYPGSPPHTPFDHRQPSPGYQRAISPVHYPGSPPHDAMRYRRAGSLAPAEFRKASKTEKKRSAVRKENRDRKRAEARRRKQMKQHSQPRAPLAFAATHEDSQPKPFRFASIASFLELLPPGSNEQLRTQLRTLSAEGVQGFLDKLNADLEARGEEDTQEQASDASDSTNEDDGTEDSDVEDSDVYMSDMDTRITGYASEGGEPERPEGWERMSEITAARGGTAVGRAQWYQRQRSTFTSARDQQRTVSAGPQGFRRPGSFSLKAVQRLPELDRRAVLHMNRTRQEWSDKAGLSGPSTTARSPPMQVKSFKRQLHRGHRRAVPTSAISPGRHRHSRSADAAVPSPAKHQPAKSTTTSPAKNKKQKVPEVPRRRILRSHRMKPSKQPDAGVARQPQGAEASVKDVPAIPSHATEKAFSQVSAPCAEVTPVAATQHPTDPRQKNMSAQSPQTSVLRKPEIITDWSSTKYAEHRRQQSNKRSLPTRPPPPPPKHAQDDFGPTAPVVRDLLFQSTSDAPASDAPLAENAGNAPLADDAPLAENAEATAEAAAEADSGVADVDQPPSVDTDSITSSETVSSADDDLPHVNEEDTAISSLPATTPREDAPAAAASQYDSEEQDEEEVRDGDEELQLREESIPQSSEISEDEGDVPAESAVPGAPTAKRHQVMWKLDSDGPVLFDHLTRQPLGLGHSPDPRILERLEASDKLLWMDEFKRLMRLCKERRCQMQETIYIIRYEEYRFTQPHSQRVMVPNIVEGFLVRWRDWIQGDPVVREVCHAHLLRLTRLRLLAPMQTQHCLKVLNGTVTPYPDYMFDHLRPKDFVAQSAQMKVDAPKNRQAACARPRGKSVPPVPDRDLVHDAEVQPSRPRLAALQRRPPAHGVEPHAKRARTGDMHSSVAAKTGIRSRSGRYCSNSPDRHSQQHGKPTVNKEAFGRMFHHELNKKPRSVPT